MLTSEINCCNWLFLLRTELKLSFLFFKCQITPHDPANAAIPHYSILIIPFRILSHPPPFLFYISITILLLEITLLSPRLAPIQITLIHHNLIHPLHRPNNLNILLLIQQNISGVPLHRKVLLVTRTSQGGELFVGCSVDYATNVCPVDCCFK